MDFKIHSEQQSNSATQRRNPGGYSSTPARLRMITLITALGLVLFSMNEASKPETWEKLGFGSNANNHQANPAILQTASSRRESPQDHSLTRAEPAMQRFWNTYFNTLSVEQKKTVVSRLATASATTEIKDLDRWTKGSKKFLQTYLSNNTGLRDDDIEMLRRSQEEWAAAMAVTTTSRDANFLKPIRNLFRDNIYDVVEDRSAMNRSIESPAWNWAWAELSDAHRPHEQTSFIQLSGQPESYRGDRIRINGSARGLQKIDLPDNHELGFDSYKVLWVKPADSNRVPYCIYVKDLPDEFPQPGDGFVTLNEDVDIDGVFFKLRSYEATNQQIEICPLIIANTVLWSPKPAELATAPNSWKPPNWLLILFFIGMPILAAQMAWKVYRSTSTSSHATRIGANADQSSTWNQLSSRDDIKSDLDRIKELDTTN